MCNCEKLFVHFGEDFKMLIAEAKDQSARDMVVEIYASLLNKVFDHHKQHLDDLSKSFKDRA